VGARVTDRRRPRPAKAGSKGTSAVTIDREPSRPPAGSSQGASGRTAVPERNLDVLRAFALVLVVGIHLIGMGLDLRHQPRLWQIGQIGLLLFFVHTSLVLMASLERLETIEKSRRRLCFVFYVRRAFRIYPLAIACVLGYLAFQVPGTEVPRPDRPGQFIAPTLPELLANLTLTQDIFGIRYVIGVMWSLPVEVQMYLVLPICYFAAKRGVRHVIGLFALAVIGWSARDVFHLPGTWRFSVLGFGPCFLAGVMAYAVLRRRAAPRFPGWTWPLFLVALSPALVLMRASIDMPERGWLFCVVVGACIPLFREMNRSWLTRVAFVFAKYSYGVYLAHIAAMWVAFVALSESPPAARWLTFLTLVIGLPFLLYQTVERPMIALGIRISRRERERGSVATAAAAVAPPP
jgi:peptidoglycan/LPS O-acetylase OafA/YrhL